MRIAVSGSHRVGKTTLVEALADALPGHESVPEPYHLLEEEGHAFPETPSIDDFEMQLERSLEAVRESGPDVVFDRCPLDFLGYLATHRDAGAFRPEDWLGRIEESVAALDAVVFVPIEEPDRIAVSPSEAPLRAEVDEALRHTVVDDAYGLGAPVVVVSGPLEERVRQALDPGKSLTG